MIGPESLAQESPNGPPPRSRWRPAALDRLTDQPHLSAALRNAAWLFGDKALRMAVGVLVGAWVARYLGPSSFGEMAYVLSFVALFGAIAQLGLDAVAIRDIARDPAQSSRILGTVLRLRLASGVAAWFGAVALMALLRPGDTHSLMLVAICAAGLVLQSADTVDLWFQSQLQSRRTVVSKGWAYLAANVAKVAAILVGAPLLVFVAVATLEFALAAGVLAWQYRRFPTQSRWQWDRLLAGELVRESLPYLIAGIAVLVYMRIDQVMIRSLAGEHELGLYSAMLPLSTALHVVPMALCSSVAPSLARLRRSDPARYELAVARLFTAMWWSMLPLAATVSLLAGPLVTMLYGSPYADAAPMLALHAFSSVPVALGVAQSIWIVNEGRNRVALYRTLIGAACNVAMNLLLIPRWGGLGAACAALSAQTAAAVLSNLLFAPSMFRQQWRSLLLLPPAKGPG